MSKLFRLDGRDLLKGLFVAVLSGVFASASAIIQNQGFDLTEQHLYAILGVAVTSALGYLSKQLITDENDKIGGVL